MGRKQRDLFVICALVALFGVLALVAIGSGGGGSLPPAPSARPVAQRFASSYTAYLAGRTSASGLPPLSDRARSILLSAGPVPEPDRQRAVVLRGVRFSGVLGAYHATALMSFDVGSRRLAAAYDLAYASRRWEVSYLVAPDFSTALAPAPPPVRVPTALERAASAFAVGYADYRSGAARRPPSDLTATLRGQLAGGLDPLAHASRTRARASLISIRVLPHGTVASVAAVVSAGTHRWTLTFLMQRLRASWQAWQFPVTESQP